MEKYISIPSPIAGRPNYLIPVSKTLSIYMDSIGQIVVTSANKGLYTFIDIAAPTAVTTGATTTFNTGKVLIDSSATFITDGIKPGDFVTKGLGADNTAQVVSVDSETQLTLNNFLINATSTAQNYSVYVDLDAPAKFFENAVLKALQSEWIDPIYEITDVPFTITNISN